jgi:ribonuclease HI
MILTINTDASFSKRHHRGSFAFWISCNQGKFSQSGMFKNKVDNPTTAEMRCIYNAFFFANKRNLQKDIKRVIVNTDSYNSIHIFRLDERSMKKFSLYNQDNIRMSKKLKKLTDLHFNECQIDFRHVKAHKHTDNARHFVNDWCDTECKKHMGSFIEKMKIK